MLLQFTFLLLNTFSQMLEVYDICNVMAFFFCKFIQFLSIPCKLLKSTIPLSEFYSFAFCNMWLCLFLKLATQLIHSETHWAAIHFSFSQLCMTSKSTFTVTSIESLFFKLLDLIICVWRLLIPLISVVTLCTFTQIPYFLFNICEEAD